MKPISDFLSDRKPQSDNGYFLGEKIAASIQRIDGKICSLLLRAAGQS